jgi:hypothetical protein
MRLICLHTATSNVAVFERAHAALALDDVTLDHVVRADLLAAAVDAGGLTPAIESETVAALGVLRHEADGVLLTCSTLGPAADGCAFGEGAPVLRVDAALAEQAVADGGRVAVLCAVATTLEPTRTLFERAAAATGATIAVDLVAGAWDHFVHGDVEAYHRSIATAAEAAHHGGADVVALAQASMSGAERHVTSGRVLASPSVGLAALVQAIRAAG